MQSSDVPAYCPVFVIRNFIQRTGGVCFAGLENALRGDIRIDNHMKVGGSDIGCIEKESREPPSFLREKLHDGVPHSPSVLMPAQLESGFDHRFASMIVETRFGFATANVAVGTPAAVTRQVRPVSGECQQVGHSLDSGKWAWSFSAFFKNGRIPCHRGLVEAIAQALKCTNSSSGLKPGPTFRS